LLSWGGKHKKTKGHREIKIIHDMGGKGVSERRGEKTKTTTGGQPAVTKTMAKPKKATVVRGKKKDGTKLRPGGNQKNRDPDHKGAKARWGGRKTSWWTKGKGGNGVGKTKENKTEAGFHGDFLS